MSVCVSVCVCVRACVLLVCLCLLIIYCGVLHSPPLTVCPVVNQLSTIHSVRVFSQESSRNKKNVSHQVLLVFDSGLSLSMTSCLTYNPKRCSRHKNGVHSKHVYEVLFWAAWMHLYMHMVFTQYYVFTSVDCDGSSNTGVTPRPVRVSLCVCLCVCLHWTVGHCREVVCVV